MRLTLRTLLAYRDGVLSQADHEDLHRRIQQSPDAGNLLRRIQELTSSPNVMTPKLDSTGLSGPNMIAEYLDDVLTSTRVADLERLFLEYNEHLCELAHCHQLLAQALHTHVEIPESLRQTALALGDPSKRAEIKSHLLTQSRKMSKQLVVAEIVESDNSASGAGLPSSSTTVAASAPLASEGADISSKISGPVASISTSPTQQGLNLEGVSLSTEVPEYLLGSRKRRWQIPAAILALAALLCLLVWQSIGSWGDLSALMQKRPDNKPVQSEPDTSVTQKTPDNIGKNLEANGNKPAPTSNSDSSTEATNSKTNPAEATPLSEPAKIQEPGPEPSADNIVAEPAKLPMPNELDKSQANLPIEPVEVERVASAAPGLVLSPQDETEKQGVVLLASADATTVWDGAQSMQSARLIVPPVSRTTLRFDSWKWSAVGPNVLEFSYNQSKPQITSSILRALISCSSPGQSLLLKTPQGEFEVQLLDKMAWVGLEIDYRPIEKGALNEPSAYAPVIVMVASIDGVTTNPQLLSVRALSDDTTIKIDAPAQGVAIVGGKMEQFALQTPPLWYRKKSSRAIDLMGLADFQKALDADNQPMREKLRALASDPRPEVASLAIQSAMLLGDWQPWSAHLLVNDRMRSHWSNCIDLTRQVLVDNPNAINNLLAELQVENPKESDRIIELLIGPTQEAQSQEGLINLVKGLEPANSLPVRVLSAYQLKRLTGEDFSYQPHAPVRAAIQQWRSKLTSNKVGLLSISDPIVERYGRP